MEKAKPLTILLHLLLLSLSRPLPPSTAISDEELEAAIYSLRSRGYHLFGNAITSSDVHFDLLFSNDSFTLFAPTDAALFSLDMVFSASAYIRVLRHHVAIGRHSLPALRALIPGTSIPTLLPSRKIVVSYRDSVDLISIDGVDVVHPGLFYGQNIAVHGLAGILTQRTTQPSDNAPALRSQDSRYAPANSPDISSQPSRQATPNERRKTKGATVVVLPPIPPHSHASASGIAYPPLLSRTPTTPSGSPDGSPRMTPTSGPSGILISPATHPIVNEISGCPTTATPAGFSLGYGTCRSDEDMCAPANESPNQNAQN